MFCVSAASYDFFLSTGYSAFTSSTGDLVAGSTITDLSLVLSLSEALKSYSVVSSLLHSFRSQSDSLTVGAKASVVTILLSVYS